MMDIKEMTNVTFFPPSGGNVCLVSLFDRSVEFTRIVGRGKWGKDKTTTAIAEKTIKHEAITEPSFNRLMAVLTDWHRRDWCTLHISLYHNNLVVEAEM
jgi:hypothetical protein